MKGQWIGSYTGSTDGQIIINVDEVDDHYEIEATMNPSDNALPSSRAYITTENKNKKHKVKAYINPINPETSSDGDWEYIKKHYPQVVDHSKEADVDISFQKEKVVVKAISDLNVTLQSTITNTNQNESVISASTLTWDGYKKQISKYLDQGYIFRGQKKPWPLRTSFHRNNRYRISVFLNKDLQELHRKLSAITPNYFDTRDPKQNGAFINLLQHHGYPTPLLDWTRSPYVAAFFAFRKLPKNIGASKENIRIFIFNLELWKKSFRQIDNLNPKYPHLSVADFIGLNNPRMIPQQAITTATNINSIEAYILHQEKVSGEKFIGAIDIPMKYRDQAIKELSFMGITAGSMFPGIDGLCEDSMEKNF